MKKVINQKRYDTDTAKKMASIDNGCPANDLNYWEETLYRKTTGEFFLHGAGGANTKYADRVGVSGWRGGERLMPLAYHDAQEWAETNLSGDEYEEIFGAVSEDGERITISLSLQKVTVETLKRKAAQAEKGLSEFVTDLIMK